jgi:hypothetical protein
MNKICPNCQSTNSLKKIIYGEPTNDFDVAKFNIGGCIPSEATVHCSVCQWEDAPSEFEEAGE